MYEPVIGLEVHAQLATKSKVFCGCSTEFGSPPNTHTCPVCLGLPGALPVLNRKALDYALKAAISLDCQIQKVLRFDRKNYFYPDLPKNFQISQYNLPLALGGYLELEKGKRIGIRRAHLEEDAGKLIHRGEDLGSSYVDYNRTGLALLEIVSEPDINSPEEAYEYLLTLKLLLEYLEVSDCDMEKGSLRCDANISLKLKGKDCLGTKTELKNMNSFKGIKDALGFEIERQKKNLERGQELIQETRLWDEAKHKTFPMRSKEEAQEYRYFPEPDLVPFVVEDEYLNKIRKELPEFPQVKLRRLIQEYGISEYEAKLIIQDKDFADYFEEVVKLYPKAKIVANWLIGPVKAMGRPLALHLSELLRMADEGIVSGLGAKEILAEMLKTGLSAHEIIKEKDLTQISDVQKLKSIIDEVLTENENSVKDYLKGKENALMFLVGGVMKATKGRANPKLAQQMLKEKLGGIK